MVRVAARYTNSKTLLYDARMPPQRAPRSPLLIRRARKWFALALALSIIGLQVVLWSDRAAVDSARAWLAVTIVALLFAAWLAATAAKWLARRRAAAAGWLVCPECTYPLDRKEGTCPECGREYRKRDLRDEWLAG